MLRGHSGTAYEPGWRLSGSLWTPSRWCMQHSWITTKSATDRYHMGLLISFFVVLCAQTKEGLFLLFISILAAKSSSWGSARYLQLICAQLCQSYASCKNCFILEDAETPAVGGIFPVRLKSHIKEVNEQLCLSSRQVANLACGNKLSQRRL